jgi:hypothetical protein
MSASYDLADEMLKIVKAISCVKLQFLESSLIVKFEKN